jgi:hypothetical protein
VTDLQSIELEATLTPESYRLIRNETAWPAFRLRWVQAAGHPSTYTAAFVSCGADPELTPTVMVEGRLVNFGSTLYIEGGPNDGREVQVVGFNLEHECIVQAVDGLPLFWPEDHPRHVLDVPAHRLTWVKPVPTLLEAARAVVDAAIAHAAPRMQSRVAVRWDVYDELAAAVEREEGEQPF